MSIARAMLGEFEQEAKTNRKSSRTARRVSPASRRKDAIQLRPQRRRVVNPSDAVNASGGVRELDEGAVL